MLLKQVSAEVGRQKSDENLLDDLLTGSKIEDGALLAADVFEAPMDVQVVDDFEDHSKLKKPLHIRGLEQDNMRTDSDLTNNFTFREQQI